MNPDIARRISAFYTDFLVVFSTALLALLLINSDIFRRFVFSLLQYRLGNPYFLSWHLIMCLFFVGPLLLVLSFYMFSASPGQLLNRIREQDDARKGRIDIIQALIHAYAVVPSMCFLGGIPQIIALFNFEERSLTQMLAGTRTWIERTKKGDPIHNETWVGIVYLVIGLGIAAFTNSILLFRSSAQRPGLIIGGTYVQQTEFFKSLVLTSTKNNTPQKCFEGLRLALLKRDSKILTDQFTLRGQLYIAKRIRSSDLFEGLPQDGEWVRMEPINKSSVKVIWHRVNDGHASTKEDEIILVRELNEWKFDVMSFLENRRAEALQRQKTPPQP